ncbi:hypothetical protein FQN57_000720 [Myotisia sp. PD_48]|nr:hypothetical protein FQN57_000720 [Myotisia sp. PD_48]
MKTQKKPGGYWSETNPVPTIQQFLAELDSGKQSRDRQIDEEERQKKQKQRAEGKRTRHDDQERRISSEVESHQKLSKSKRHGRVVTDPTTGREVGIDDASKEVMEWVKEPQLSVPNINLGLPTSLHTKPEQSLDEYKRVQDVTAPPEPIATGTTSDVPIHGEKTNILFHPTPSISFELTFKTLERHARILCAGIFASILVVSRFAGGKIMIYFPLACGITSAVWLWTMRLIQKGRASEWHSEQLRGETATVNLIPESAEWINSFLGVFWGLINPEMFATVADTIEDVMHASLPGIVENVRIGNIDQGSNPFRVVSLRALPDEKVPNLVDGLREYNLENKDADEAIAEEEGGQPYNLELTFAYHAKPGKTTFARAENMHMLVVFYLGVRGLFGVPFPVFVELIEVVGTVRLRVQLVPEAPFAKSVTFSLMGAPHVRAGCIPMVKRGINILNLPLISNFVNYAIRAAASLYVAPKSMSIDLGMLLGGDDIQKDTAALGILWVRIRRATNLSKQDRRGSEGGGSDPYINLSFSKYGKPMYCTRVICDDLNPVWEESSALLVTPELLKANELLSVELWDSDRNTADDIVGKVELSLQKLIQHPGEMFPETSKLSGMDAGTEMPGELQWEVGYFCKPKFRTALRTDGKNQNLPEGMKDHPELQDEKGNITNEDEEAVICTPPDPLWPSGICTIIIHQIVNLQVEEPKGTLGNRKGNEYEPAKSYGENIEEEGKECPSSYCKINLNDEPVFCTRTKAVSSKPVFNAGTERFVRDWRSAFVTVTVRDQRHREHDPILGIVPLKLSDILHTSSQVTRWYPLDGGIGFGRIRISLLFRSVELQLPPRLLGYDVGTFHIISDKIAVVDCDCKSKLKLRTTGCYTSISRSLFTTKEHGGYFDISSSEVREKCIIPTKHRYRSAIVFELQHKSAPAYALLWLQELVDNQNTFIDLPIWTTKHGLRLTQNYITEGNWEAAKSVPGLDDLTLVGRLQLTGCFRPGFHRRHEELVADNVSREAFETWDACVAEGVRGDIQVEVPRLVQILHERSLIQDRDILRQATDKSRQRRSKERGSSVSVEEAIKHSMSGARRDYASKISNLGDGQAIDHGVMEPPEHSGNEGLDRNEGTEGGKLNAIQYRDDDGPNLSEYDSTDDNQNEYDEHSGDSDELESLPTTTDRQNSQETVGERKQRIGNRANRRSEWRKQRGVMQWRPARNAAFVKHEAAFAMKKVKHKFMGDMTGREPDIRTEVTR